MGSGGHANREGCWACVPQDARRKEKGQEKCAVGGELNFHTAHTQSYKEAKRLTFEWQYACLPYSLEKFVTSSTHCSTIMSGWGAADAVMSGALPIPVEHTR